MGVWCLAGRFKLAGLVQYVPLPVIGGYLGYVGYFIIAGGAGLVTGVSVSAHAGCGVGRGKCEEEDTQSGGASSHGSVGARSYGGRGKELVSMQPLCGLPLIRSPAPHPTPSPPHTNQHAARLHLQLA